MKEDSPCHSEKTDPFFGRTDWLAFWLVLVVTLVVYTATLAPTVTLEMCGVLAVGADHLGVPHPPGFPIWTLTAWCFTKALAFISYRGQPNPAWAIAFASAFFSSLGAATIALLVCRSGSDLLQNLCRDPRVFDERSRRLFGWTGGVASSLIFAFTSTNWSQSVIGEVHGLNTFFLAVIMTLAYRWLCRSSMWILVTLNLVFGLSLANYQFLVLVFPALVALVLIGNTSLFRDFVIAMIPYVILIFLSSSGYLPPIIHPLHYTGIIYLSLNFVILVLVYFFLPHGRTVALSILAFEVGLAAYGYLPLSSETNPPINWGYSRTWEGFLHTIKRGQYERIMPTPVFSKEFVHQIADYAADLRTQFTLPVAILGFLPFAVCKTTRPGPAGNAAFLKWIVVTLIGFLAMSVLFVDIASPKGDIQDYFIQRVKFISSFALFSIWVGYGVIIGLVYALTWLDSFLHNNRQINALAKRVGITLVLLLPLVPICKNAFNKEQIRIVGGAEQNGHDFGWQFGNYQLRGAAAISEELDPEEEPLPNPSFPAEMGQAAIFFGGTDPGRFVNTYMVFGAEVREDVYVITQNALADNTYMEVIRDLYGDRMWLPAQTESATAFRRYVEEVRAGKRPQNAELKIEGGRVQVSGALGVMEINGILSQMIFEHNYMHPFYVEESYVIRWMYPYLEPHGLIMKINREPMALTDEMVRNDMDFWDWYCRRLIGNGKFLRDVVARKSFSKLRSALGGLYAARGKFRQAEVAYQQARTLYPLSPEANFRLAQEVYLTHGRFADAREVIQQFSKEDPGNRQAVRFLDQISAFENITARVAQLEQTIPQGKLSLDAAFELADLYLQIGQVPKFMNLAGDMMANTNLPPIAHFRVATLFQKAGRLGEMTQALDLFLTRIPPDAPAEAFIDMTRMYLAAQKPDKASTMLQEYLKRRPTDWKAWMDQASLHLSLGKTSEAIRSLEFSIRAGGQEAINVLGQNPSFAPIRDEAVRRSRDPPTPSSEQHVERPDGLNDL